MLTAARIALVTLLSIMSGPTIHGVVLAIALTSPSLIEPIWRNYADSTSDFTLMLYHGPVFGVVTYFSHGLLLLALGAILQRKYKMQKTKFIVWDSATVKKVACNLATNLIVVNTAVSFLVYCLKSATGIGIRREGFPTSAEMLRDMVASILVYEFIFYHGHSLLHSKGWYRTVHKIHHEFTAPIGLLATYCHPFENVISNVGPLVLWMALSSAHAYTTALYLLFGTISTQCDHGGYTLPFTVKNNFHDFHHETAVGNYGAIGFMDWLYGTDRLWKARLDKQLSESKRGKEPKGAGERRRENKTAG